MGASWNWNVLRGKPRKHDVMVSLASLLSWSGMACHCYLLTLTPLSALQSYFIFSIGNITPIFQETYKVCA